MTSFGSRVSVEQARELLGISGEESALALVKHLLTGNTAQALEVINSVADEGVDIRPLHRMTVELLRAALLIKSGAASSLDLSKDTQSQLTFAAESVPMEQIMRALRLFGRVSFRFDQPSPLPLELAAVERGLPPETAAPAPAVAAPAPAAAPRMPQPSPVSPVPRPAQAAPEPTYRRTPPPPAAPVPPLDPSAPIDQRLAAQWPSILRSLTGVPKRKFDVAALLRSSGHREIRGSDLIVTFPHQSNSERLMGELEDPRCRMEVERRLQEALGQPLTVVVDTGEQRSNGERSGEAGGGHLIRAAVGYGGQVVNEAPPPAPAPAPTPYVDDTPAAPAPDPVSDAGGTPPAPDPAPYAGGAPVGPPPASDAVPNGATHVAEPEPAIAPVSPDDPNEPPKEWNE